jgi:hypothetical protein
MSGTEKFLLTIRDDRAPGANNFTGRNRGRRMWPE